MNRPNSHLIKTLKAELKLAIIRNNYNLLSPEILKLSRQLDDLMMPLFEVQLKSPFITNSIND